MQPKIRRQRLLTSVLALSLILGLTACGGGQQQTNSSSTQSGITGGSSSADKDDSAATKDKPSNFYKGKNVTIITGFDPGGGYDLFGRLLAMHLGKHIPGNPNVIVKNMPGAGSLVAANHVFNNLAGDATMIGSFAREAPMEEIFGTKEVRFKTKEFNWLGSLGEETNVCLVRHDSPVQSIQDAMNTSIRVAADAPGSGSYTHPLLLNGFVGTKFELITGYSGGSSERNLAVERGEVDMACQTWSATVSVNQDWLDRGFVNVIVQNALNKNPDIPEDVPLILDLAKDDRARNLLEVFLAWQTMGRPYTMPPGVPEAQVALMRKAFMDTAVDPAFLADAEKQSLPIAPMAGNEMEEIIARIFQTPQAEINELKSMLSP